MTVTRLYLALGFVVLLLAPSAAADSGQASLADGFGQIAVDWSEPVTVATRATATLFEVVASRPFPLETDALVEDLAPLVDDASLDETRTTLRLRPAGGVAIEAAVLDERSIRLGLSAADTPTLGLRLGRHDGFWRLVFEPVDRRHVQLGRESGRLVLTLPGRLTPAERRRLETVPGLAAVAGAGNRLFLQLSPGATATELFVPPDKQVLDVAVADRRLGGTASIDAQSERSRSLAALRPRSKPIGAGVPAADAPAGDAVAEAERDAGPSPSLAEAVSPSWRSGSPLPVALEAVDRGQGEVALRFAWPEPVPAAAFTRGSSLWLLFGASSRAIDVDTAAFTQVARRFVTAMSEERHAAATVFRLTLRDAVVSEVASDAGEWRFILAADAFPPRAPVAREVAPPNADAELLPGIEAVVSLVDPTVGDTLQVGLASSLTGQLQAERRFAGLHFLPSLQGAVWRRLVETSAALRLEANGLALGPADGLVRDSLDGDGGPPTGWPALAFELPAPAPLPDAYPDRLEAESGEPIPGRPQRTEVPSVMVDDVAGEGEGDRANAAADLPLALEASAVSPGGTERAGMPSGDGNPLDVEERETAPLLGLAHFASGKGRHFWDRRAGLMRAIDEADEVERQAARLDLARFLVAHGLGAEALTLLDDIDPSAAASGGQGDRMPAWLALEGAARLLTGSHAEAVQRLASASLREDDETALWRSAARAATGDWDRALPEWERGQVYLDAYPPPISATLAEHGIMLLLQTGRVDEAFATIEELAVEDLPQAARDRLRLLEATALERDGALDEARTIWRALIEEAVPEVRSLASLALVESDLAAGLIDVSGAVARLGADSGHWRGQRDEVALWRRLAGLRHAAGETTAALTTLQEVLSRQPPAPMAAAVSGDMVEIVGAIFAELAAGERSAASALLAYRRFAELVPSGPSGDSHVELLAEQLAALGLTDAAVDILRDRLRQSDARNQGRATLGLALARLLAASGDQRGAIKALVDTTPIDELEPQLAQSRRALLAALGERQDETSALDAAAGANPRLGTLRDRARAAFDLEQWPTVLDAVGSLEAALPPVGALDPSATELVLMAATAARQLGEDALAARLAGRYADRLPEPADADALRLLAIPMRLSGDASSVAEAAETQSDRMRAVLAPGPAS